MHPQTSTFAVLLLLVASCANMRLTETGFLDSYDELEPAGERQVWGVPDEILLGRVDGLEGRIQRGEIRSIVVDPVVYRPVDGARYVMTPSAAEALKSSSTDRLRKELGKKFDVIDEPVAGAVRVRMAITDVNPSSVWFNVVTVIVAFPFDMGGVSGEIEVVDAMSGERLAAMTATREGTPFLILECFTKHGHARHGIMKWSRDVGRLLQGD